jgi:hypothetical protein
MVLAKTLTDEIVASEYTKLFTRAYPRSGSTWTGRLLADVLDSPYEEEPGKPIYFFGNSEEGKYLICKTHMNEKHAPLIEQLPGPAVYIYRDPRDICVSRYIYLRHPDLNYTICSMAGLPDPLGRPRRPYAKWPRFMKEHKEYYTIAIRYEDLHETPIETLRDVVYALTGLELAESRIAETVERQRFDVIQERFPDRNVIMNFVLRKGIIGDWKNHFSRDDGRLFQEHFGRLMLDQGYIKDGDWWEGLPI